MLLLQNGGLVTQLLGLPLVLGKTRPWIESCAIALTDVKNRIFPSGASMLDKIWLLRGGPVLWIALQ